MSNRAKTMSIQLIGNSLKEQDVVNQQTVEESKTLSKKRGRQPGKRSSPDYEQVGLYIPKKLHQQVKKVLIDYDDKDFSDLVSNLLEQWVKEEQA